MWFSRDPPRRSEPGKIKTLKSYESNSSLSSAATGSSLATTLTASTASTAPTARSKRSYLEPIPQLPADALASRSTSDLPAALSRRPAQRQRAHSSQSRDSEQSLHRRHERPQPSKEGRALSETSYRSTEGKAMSETSEVMEDMADQMDHMLIAMDDEDLTSEPLSMSPRGSDEEDRPPLPPRPNHRAITYPQPIPKPRSKARLASHVNRVWAYANSRLPPHLPPLKLYVLLHSTCGPYQLTPADGSPPTPSSA